MTTNLQRVILIIHLLGDVTSVHGISMTAVSKLHSVSSSWGMAALIQSNIFSIVPIRFSLSMTLLKIV